MQAHSSLLHLHPQVGAVVMHGGLNVHDPEEQADMCCHLSWIPSKAAVILLPHPASLCDRTHRAALRAGRPRVPHGPWALIFGSCGLPLPGSLRMFALKLQCNSITAFFIREEVRELKYHLQLVSPVVGMARETQPGCTKLEELPPPRGTHHQHQQLH